MIELSDHAEGCVLPVRAQPGAKRDGVQGEQNGALKVSVTAPPEDGRANQALVEVLREELGLKRSQVELLSGQTSRDKKFLIRGGDREALEAKLRKWTACRGVGIVDPRRGFSGAARVRVPLRSEVSPERRNGPYFPGTSRCRSFPRLVFRYRR